MAFVTPVTFVAGTVPHASDLNTLGSDLIFLNGEIGLPIGLTGAVAAVRFVGGTVSGAPTAGTFAVGDFVVAQNGHTFICTVAGTPGTWVDPAAASGLTSAGASIGADVTLTANATTTIQTSASLAVGTWLVHFGATVVAGAATTDICEFTMAVGTATATFVGQQSTGLNLSVNGGEFCIDIEAIVTVTVAGTLVFTAHNGTTAATALKLTQVGSLAGATGYTALKVA